jgi:AraC family transcriptional regulator of arabinose operon
MGKSTRLRDRWRHIFDEQHNPVDTDLARLFITDCFRVHYHLPRTYYDFTCHRIDVISQGVLDFPINHPVSVEFWAIYISIEGKGTLISEGCSEPIEPRSLVIVPPGCTCSLFREEKAKFWRYDLLRFRSKLEWIELLQWVADLTRPVYFDMPDTDNFQYIVLQADQLESTTYLPGALSERLCKNIIENILIRIRLYADVHVEKNGRIHKKIQAAVDYILNHYEKVITLETIADHVNVSPSRLGALFREHLGISAIKWRDHIRMQKARELLANSDAAVNEVGSLVGYTDALYFSRRFKQHFGYSPKALREQEKLT